MKKVISLLLAFTMMMSLLFVVQAADNETITISAGELTAADFNAEDGVYYVPVKVDKFHYDSAEKGYAVIALNVYFDSRKIQWDENIQYVPGGVKAVAHDGTKSDFVFLCEVNKDNKNELLLYWASDKNTLCNEGISDGIIVYLPFKPVKGAKGKAVVGFKNALFITPNMERFMYTNNSGVVVQEGGIQITEDLLENDEFVFEMEEVVIPCEEIVVEYNRHVNEIPFPETVAVNNNMGGVSDIKVEWDKSAYNGAVAGTYLICGTLDNQAFVDNLLSKQKFYEPTVKVTVMDAENPGTVKLSPERAMKNPRFNAMFGKMFYNALFMATEN